MDPNRKAEMRKAARALVTAVILSFPLGLLILWKAGFPWGLAMILVTATTVCTGVIAVLNYAIIHFSTRD